MLLLRFAHDCGGAAACRSACHAVVRAATAMRAVRRIARFLLRRESVMIIHSVVVSLWARL